MKLIVIFLLFSINLKSQMLEKYIIMDEIEDVEDIKNVNKISKKKRIKELEDFIEGAFVVSGIFKEKDYIALVVVAYSNCNSKEEALGMFITENKDIKGELLLHIVTPIKKE